MKFKYPNSLIFNSVNLSHVKLDVYFHTIGYYLTSNLPGQVMID